MLLTEPRTLCIGPHSPCMLLAGLRLQCKYKGHSNRNTQIRASFAADGQSIICGSDDGHVYIWNTDSIATLAAAPSEPKKVFRHIMLVPCTADAFLASLCSCCPNLIALQ